MQNMNSFLFSVRFALGFCFLNIFPPIFFYNLYKTSIFFRFYIKVLQINFVYRKRIA